MANLSLNLLLLAFFAYLTATIFFVFSLSKQRKESVQVQTNSSKWGIGFVLLGLGYHLAISSQDGRLRDTLRSVICLNT